MGETEIARDAVTVGSCSCRKRGQSKIRSDQMQRQINNRGVGGASKRKRENADGWVMRGVLQCYRAFVTLANRRSPANGRNGIMEFRRFDRAGTELME